MEHMQQQQQHCTFSLYRLANVPTGKKKGKQSVQPESTPGSHWNHCSVLGRFEILTFLLSLLEVPGSVFTKNTWIPSTWQLIVSYSFRHLLPFCSLPSPLFRGLNAVHPEPAAFGVCSQCWAQQRTSREAVHVGRTLHQCSGTSAVPHLSARNSLRSQHTTANPSDTWSLTPGGRTSLIKQHISSRATNFSFLLEGKYALCSVFSSPLVFLLLYWTSRLVSQVSLQLGEF